MRFVFWKFQPAIRRPEVMSFHVIIIVNLSGLKMVQRLVYRRQNTYNTKSNKRRLVKTPGNRLTYLHRNKQKRLPRCALTKQKLHGIKPSRPGERSRIPKRKRRVTRAYGGVLSCKAVQEKILRAYLQEEMKNVKKYLQAKHKKK